MTTIKITGDSIELSGHANDSVVCHALSGISQMVSNYVDSNEWGSVDIDHDNAYLKITLKEKYRNENLIRAFEEALIDISIENHSSINLMINRMTDTR